MQLYTMPLKARANAPAVQSGSALGARPAMACNETVRTEPAVRTEVRPNLPSRYPVPRVSMRFAGAPSFRAAAAARPHYQAVAAVHARQSAEVDPDLPRDIASRFGRRLRQLRLERQLTQMDVAVHFGIDRTFLSDVERGRKGVCLPTLEVMALGFGLSLSELLEGV